MKHIKHILIFLFAWTALLFSSCQLEEQIIENPPVEDVITADSILSNLIQRAAIEDRSFDDFIDFADCLSINLPFTISINDIMITISTENDYEEVIALIEKLNGDYDVEIIYPIVITLNDYTQVVINAEEELIPFLESCQEMEEDIPCIEFVFPLSFSIYNIEFELIDTVIITTNEELYLFIENIESGVLVSLNFPVQMELQNGVIITVNNNQELQAAIEAAALDCTDSQTTDFSCFNNINDILTTCVNSSVELAVFNLTFAIDDCDDPNVFNVTYHRTKTDATSNQFAIPNPSEYVVESPYTDNLIFIRVEAIANPEEYNIYSQLLVVENCNDQICNEVVLNQYLEECAWVTNGDVIFTLEFLGTEVIANAFGTEQEGQYTTSIFTIESSGQFFSQFTLSGFTGDFAILNNTYEVGFCSNKVINIHSLDPANNTLPFSGMELDCTVDCQNPGFLTNDLVIYIPFGEEAVELISGEQLDDGAITYSEDRDGNPSCAATFSNSGIIPITVTDQNDLTSQDEFAISIWFKMANEEAGDLETFFQKVNTNNEGFTVGVYDLNTPLCYSNDPPFSIWDNDWNQEIDVVWTNTDWHHLVISKNSNNVVQLWRDGILRNTESGLDIGLETLSYNLGNNLVGAIDDLRVYKRALNDNEIIQLYNLEADCFTCL